MGTLFIDTEVRSRINLKTCGLGAYAEHPSTCVLLFPYAINDEPVQLWDAYHQFRNPPRDLLDALNDDSVRLVAHNAMFDRAVLKYRANFDPPIERWYCTQARANIHGLPGGLDALSRIFKLGDDSKKAKRGEELIQMFCTPPFADPSAHPVEWLEFCEYAIFDVVAMRKLYYMMPDFCFTPLEQAVYHVDQKINDRGFYVDLELAEEMIDASEWAQSRLNARITTITSGAVQKATQRDKLREWFNTSLEVEPGVMEIKPGDLYFPDMRAETLRTALREDKAGRTPLTDEQREMIELRLLGSKSSIAKCRTALKSVSRDGRIRYTMKYAGGGRIGRSSHKGFQPGNMPRPAREKEQIADAITALKAGYLTTIWGDESMSVCADCIRGIIAAAPGHELISADWSNIEGRMLAWYANEEWKLQVFCEKDAGIGEDGYKILWNKMTGTPIENIDDFVRQQGKGCDLSMGYEGGVGAWLNIANSYQIDLVEVAASVPRNLGPDYIQRGEFDWARAGKEKNKFNLPRDIFVGVSALKHAYRDACPNIKMLWRALLDCAKTAVKNPGKVFVTAHGKVQMACDTSGEWLAVQIPSGRKIMFCKPRIRVEQMRDADDIPLVHADGSPVVREVLSAQKAPTWHRAGLYGGLFANAITQGGCRDILCHTLLRVDAAGLPIVLHVHDDITCEVPEGSNLLPYLIQLMEQREAWFDGMPLAATGFTAHRLRKD